MAGILAFCLTRASVHTLRPRLGPHVASGEVFEEESAETCATGRNPWNLMMTLMNDV